FRAASGIGGIKFTLKDNQFHKKVDNELLTGDVFFVYSLGEEMSFASSKKFLESLYQLERQFNVVLNSAESTSYENKSKQKKLNFPWIPGFDVQTAKELSDLVSSGEKIIAKPLIGLCGQGVVYLGGINDLNKICDISQFLFEKYIPASEERRYIFLDGQCIIRRKIGKDGSPGKERCTSVDLTEGNERELKIARNIIHFLGMFYGAVDFRGDYLLEVNGSGTGVAPPTASNEVDSYNLSNPIVQAVERKIKAIRL
ncbi:MAG: hypothetical protein AABX16_03555, partial [Nanoarchaeota archaeon]